MAGFTLPLIKWMNENKANTLGKAKYFLNNKDYIRYRLTGKIASEPSEIGWIPGDIRKKCYSKELFDLFGISKYFRLCPPLIDSTSIAGGLSENVAKNVNLKAGTPVIAGFGDSIAGNIGAGAINEGQALTVMGTSFYTPVITNEPIFEPKGLGTIFSSVKGKYQKLLPNTGGCTPNSEWFLDQFYGHEKKTVKSTFEFFKYIDKIISKVPVGSNGVIYHPYINLCGVMAPFYNPGAKAQFFGISVQNTREDLLRAVYEGVGLSLIDCLSSIPVKITDLRVTGGGSKSPVWCDILANCIGKTIKQTEIEEVSAFGAALAAGVAVGIYKDIDEAVETAVRIKHKYLPEEEKHKKYKEIYSIYKEIRVKLMEAWYKRMDLLRKYKQ
jgi:sugar (pentulose or hexulose) kinase